MIFNPFIFMKSNRKLKVIFWTQILYLNSIPTNLSNQNDKGKHSKAVT